jgi:endonuclease/exonuclease/phosphatase family metal-dependent hydrolase
MKKTISIATWNLHYCLELPQILKSIKESNHFKNIDFLMVQEASIHEGQEDASSIASVLGKEYTYFQATAQKLKDFPQANALIWNKRKIEIDIFDILELPPFHKDSRLHIPYKKIFDKEHRLAILLRNVLQKRISLLIEGKIYEKTFRIYVVHFDIVGFASKKRQMSFVLDNANKRKKVDIEIIAGDINTFKYFNMPQWTSIKESTQKAGFIDLTTDIKWTFSDTRFSRPYLAKHKLDAIFIRHKEKTSQVAYTSWSLDIAGSDHIPVFAKIVLP